MRSASPCAARDDALRLLLGLGHGSVRRALGEQERAAQGVVHLARDGGRRCRLLGEARLGGLGPLRHLAQAHLELADGHADPLEEVIDLIRVVSAELLLAEVDVFQELRRDIHAVSVPNTFRPHGDGEEASRWPGRMPSAAQDGALDDPDADQHDDG